MRDQQFESLNDDLAREIEQALAVEPSSEFQARVRQSVKEPPLTEAAFGWWRFATRSALAIAAVVVVAIIGWQLRPADENAGAVARVQPPLPQRRGLPPVVSPVAATPVARGGAGRTGVRSVEQNTSSRTLDWLAPVVIAEDEIAGIRALIADARTGRFERVVVSQEPAAAPATVSHPRAGDDVLQSATGSAPPNSNDAAVAPSVGDRQNVSGSGPAQMASAVMAHPIAIEPLTIEPLVPSVPDEALEGAAE
jgi:hypothetical protein